MSRGKEKLRARARHETLPRLPGYCSRHCRCGYLRAGQDTLRLLSHPFGASPEAAGYTCGVKPDWHFPGPASGLCWAIMKSMRVTWGSHKNAAGPLRETVGVLREGIGLLVWLTAWLLTVAAFIGVFVLTGLVTTLLALVWLPCLLRSKTSRKDKS